VADDDCGVLQPYHRTDPQKEAYFQQDDKKGGPTDPLLWFHDHYETILKETYSSIEDYPLYRYLKQFSPSKSASSEGKYSAAPDAGPFCLEALVSFQASDAQN